MKKKVLAVLILSALATSAFADNSGKYYLATDYGAATWSGATATINGTQNTFPNPGTIGLAVGYHYNGNFALELGYHVIGDSKLSGSTGDDTLSAKSVTLAAIGSYPLSSKFDLLAKVGFANNSYTDTLSGALTFVDGTQTSTGSSSGVDYGIGALFHATDTVGVRVMYESLGNFASGVSLSAVTVGATFDF